MQNNWFVITTNPHDPTNITMRRLSDDEAVEAQRDQIIRQALYLQERYFTPVLELADQFAAAVEHLAVDEKQKARERSKADVYAKRRQLMKRANKR